MHGMTPARILCPHHRPRDDIQKLRGRNLKTGDRFRLDSRLGRYAVGCMLRHNLCYVLAVMRADGLHAYVVFCGRCNNVTLRLGDISLYYNSSSHGTMTLKLDRFAQRSQADVDDSDDEGVAFCLPCCAVCAACVVSCCSSCKIHLSSRIPCISHLCCTSCCMHCML